MICFSWFFSPFQITGLKQEALRPSDRPVLWRVGGVMLCGIQYLLGEVLGVDPLTTTIPLTFAALAADQTLLNGAIFESAYQRLFPAYRDVIISHEAGHFLGSPRSLHAFESFIFNHSYSILLWCPLSATYPSVVCYLMGVSLRACVTSAWTARDFREIKGQVLPPSIPFRDPPTLVHRRIRKQAGTIFYDGNLSEEMAAGKVVRSSLDRLCIIIMAGVAAEALKYNRTEGGLDDERQLVDFLQVQVQPSWQLPRVQTQARWAVVQALLLIKEHQASYDAVVETLQEAAVKGETCPVGTLVEAIERNLPEVLPADKRARDIRTKRKLAERNLIKQYVEKMTYKAGGIEIGGKIPDDLLEQVCTHFYLNVPHE